MDIINWIIAHWDCIVLVAALLVGIVLTVRKNGIGYIKDLAYAFVTDAEATYGAGTGELKRSAVVSALWKDLPTIFKLLITDEQMTKLMEGELLRAKKAWEKNAALAAVAKAKDTVN